jgi:hypothetical protein
MVSKTDLISHLCGPEEGGSIKVIRTIIEQDTPGLDLEAGKPIFPY